MGEFRFVGEEALRARFLAALEPKMVEQGADVVRAAKFTRTPIDTDALAGSEHAEPPRTSANGVKVRIVAGEGLPRPYAAINERKSAIHHTHGGAHFIALSVLQSAAKLRERVAEAGREAY